ncbi:RNA-binding KH domain-containing protein [Striga asiatica]|uniref:RNA-binding KH domain-containing protein n=1 Tax=Striga asiatica TaxID=4170 RepID=A0A5A7R5I9_STRAF|nr:RNA-binding KH domain-containing protein [Striga asiatica]
MYSYTSSLSSPTLQYPSKGTRFRFLIATTLPSFSWALYTSPNPPDPINVSALNPFVASSRCANVSFLSGFSNAATFMLSGSSTPDNFHVLLLEVGRLSMYISRFSSVLRLFLARKSA